MEGGEMGKEANKELETAIRLNLISLRMKNGKTQSDVAAVTGKSVNAVGSWEQGLSLPDIYTLYKLAKYYNVNMEYFYENEVPKVIT
jgi:transcriptional regulator with XRE-family HTH domain